jgi:predicted nucleic acid-binding protein
MIATLIDTSLWIDYTRFRSPRKIKEFVAPYVLNPEAYLAEPVIFEMYRFASEAEKEALKKNFDVMPILRTPSDIWSKAAELGQACRADNYAAGALDLLVATVALEHEAEVVTFDDGFLRIAEVSALRVRVLTRPK